MKPISGFENLGRIKRNYQWFDLKTRKFGPIKKGLDYCGGVPLLYDSEEQRIYIDSTDTHTLVYGATGSLKTRSVVMPTIKLLGYAGESLIINDSKGELYSRLAAELDALGYNIVVINLRDPSSGNCWNPLYIPYQFYIKGDIDRACEFINDIAINLTSEETANQDPFWDSSAADLTFSLILLLFKYCKEYEKDITAVNISNVIALRHKLFSLGPTVKPKDTDIWKYASEDELIAARLSGSVFAANETMNSILSVFDNKMSVFSLQPTLLRMLANNDFDIADIGRKKTALFMVIPDEKTTFSALCSMFIKQSYEYLIFTAMQNGRSTVSNRVNYCLDEFSALPEIHDFPAMITAARSRDIRFLLVIQSQSSLKRKYKEDADTIMGNCGNWIFFTSRELGLLRELSELCGTQKNSQPNISTYELQHLSKDKREALILCGRLKPAIVNMIDIDNRSFSKEYYSVLEMPVGKRLERTAVDFRISNSEKEDAFSEDDSVIDFTIEDMEYEFLLHSLNNRLNGLKTMDKQENDISTETEGEPHSLEELWQQLQDN